MIIRENKIIDQFPTPKHQQICYNHRAVNEAKLLANHSALFLIIINVIILMTNGSPFKHLI